jgi:hypothetical protein
MLDKLKTTLMNRIEKNSVKSELSYVDKEGNTQTELVYLKRGKGKLGDWHQAYLPVDEVTKKWNLPNAIFGGKKNLIKLLFYLGVIATFFLAYNEIASQYEWLRNLPCVENCIKNLR